MALPLTQTSTVAVPKTLMPVAVPAPSRPAWHASESAFLAQAAPEALAAAFQRQAQALAKLAERSGAVEPVRRLALLAALGERLAGAEEETPEELRALVAVLDAEVAKLSAVAQHDEDADAQIDATLLAMQQLLAGERPAYVVLETLVATVLQDMERRGHPGLDFTVSKDRLRNFARQALNHARLVAFLVESEQAWAGRKFAAAMAALLMDAPLLHTVGAGAAAGDPRHGEHAAKLLDQLGIFEPAVVSAAAGHHERIDGSGPLGWGPAAQDSWCRLFAVASNHLKHRWSDLSRPASNARLSLRASLHDAEDGAFDQRWSLRLLDLSFHPVGSKVELATGEWAEVIATHRVGGDWNLASLPIVRLLRDRQGHDAAEPIHWNLAARADARIARFLTPAEAQQTVA